MELTRARLWTIMLGTFATLGSTIAAILGPHPHTSGSMLGNGTDALLSVLLLVVSAVLFSTVVRLFLEPFLFSPKSMKFGSKGQFVTIAATICLAVALCSFTFSHLYAFCTSLVLVAITSISAQRSNAMLTRCWEVLGTLAACLVWYFSL